MEGGDWPEVLDVEVSSSPRLITQILKREGWIEITEKEQLPRVYEACREALLVGSVGWDSKEMFEEHYDRTVKKCLKIELTHYLEENETVLVASIPCAFEKDGYCMLSWR